MPIKVLIVGIAGKMGSKVYSHIQNNSGFQCVGGFDRNKPAIDRDVPVSSDISQVIHHCEAVVDFSLPDATMTILEACRDNKKGMVIGTTGYSREQLIKLKEASNYIPILISSNMAPAVDLFRTFVNRMSAALPDSYDIEIIEKHDRAKKDAPSGTALMLGNDAADGKNDTLSRRARYGRQGKSLRKKGDITFHSIRAGSYVADHEVLFVGEYDCVSICHSAFDRFVFAEGALQAVKFIYEKKSGWFSMHDVLEYPDGS